MKINIVEKENNSLNENEINIKLEYSNRNNLEKIINHINEFEEQSNKVIVYKDNELVQLKCNDIILFFSDKKQNYCKTLNNTFRIRSKLYELEKKSENFLRISKSCIINIEQVKCFDIGQTGKVIVRFYDGTEEIVSRRKIKDVMNYLEERSI